jgi:AraC-like DNA-binding protein
VTSARRFCEYDRAVEPTADEASFIRNPVGHWRVAGCSLVWACSPTLAGSICWGRQTAEQTRDVMRLFDAFTRMAPQFDLILDGASIDRVEISSLMVFADWTRRNASELKSRIRQQVGVVAPGVGAFMLAGILPLVNGYWPLAVVQDRHQAFRMVRPNGGDALCDELMNLMHEVRGISPQVAQLRQLLADRQGQMSLAEAARAMSLSPRSLQRALREAGCSYREEQHEAYFRRAEELLAGEEKIAAIAARLGLSERALTALVRARSGVTPGEFRERLRAAEKG